MAFASVFMSLLESDNCAQRANNDASLKFGNRAEGDGSLGFDIRAERAGNVCGVVYDYGSSKFNSRVERVDIDDDGVSATAGNTKVCVATDYE